VFLQLRPSRKTSVPPLEQALVDVPWRNFQKAVTCSGDLIAAQRRIAELEAKLATEKVPEEKPKD